MDETVHGPRAIYNPQPHAGSKFELTSILPFTLPSSRCHVRFSFSCFVVDDILLCLHTSSTQPFLSF